MKKLLVALVLLLLACNLRPAAAPLPAPPLPFGEPMAVVARDGLAYLANGPGGLWILNLRTGAVEGRLDTAEPGFRTLDRPEINGGGGVASAVSVAGDFAFLLLQRKGYDTTRTHVLRVDVRDPAHPVPAGCVLLKGTASQIQALDGQRAVVLRQLGGPFPPNRSALVSLIRFAEPDRAGVVASLETPARSFQAERLTGNGLAGRLDGAPVHFPCDWEAPAWKAREEGGPPLPKPEVELDGEGVARPVRVVTRGPVGRLRAGQGVCLVSGNGLFVYGGGPSRLPPGLGDPNPYGGEQLRARFLEGESVADAVEVGEGHYFAASDKGLWEIREGRPTLVGPPCRRLAWNGSQLWVADEAGLSARGGGRVALGSVQAMEAQGSLVAVAAGRSGLQLVDFSDLAHPRLRGRYFDRAKGRMSVVDVRLAGSRAYVADADNGVSVLDVSDPDKPSLQTFVPCPNALGLALFGTTLAVANGMYGTVWVPLSDPTHPTLTPGGDTGALAAQGNALFGLVSGRLQRWTEVPRGRSFPRLEKVGQALLPMGIPHRLAVSADGRRLWIANDEGWNVPELDLTDVTHPRLTCILETGGFARDVAVPDPSAGLALVAAVNQQSWQLFRPGRSEPVRVSPLSRPGRAVWSGSSFWASSGKELQGFDCGDPARPRSLGRLPVWAALSSWPGGLGGADASSWRTFRSDGTPLEQFAQAGVSASAGDGRQTVLGTNGELIWLDGVRETARMSVPGGVTGLALEEGWLAVAGRQLSVYDRQTRRMLASLPCPPGVGTYRGDTYRFSDVRWLNRDGKRWLAALDEKFGLRLYAFPGLREVGNFVTQGGDYTGIAVDRGQVYVSNNWRGLARVAGDRAVPIGLGPGSTGPLARDGKLYFQGNVDRTLHIADVSSGGPGRELGAYPLPEGPSSGDLRRFGACFPEVDGSVLYTPGNARIFDVSDPAHPTVVGECPEAGFQNDSCALARVGGHRYLVLSNEDALKVVDVGDPVHPRLVGQLPGDFSGGYYFGRGLEVVGSTVYVVNRVQLNLVDISHPERPRLRSILPLSGFCSDLRVRDGLAYVAGYFGGLHLVDVQDGDHPTPVGHFAQGVYQDGPGWDNLTCYQSLAVDGNRCYLAEYYSGLQTWEIRR